MHAAERCKRAQGARMGWMLMTLYSLRSVDPTHRACWCSICAHRRAADGDDIPIAQRCGSAGVEPQLERDAVGKGAVVGCQGDCTLQTHHAVGIAHAMTATACLGLAEGVIHAQRCMHTVPLVPP